MRTPPDAVASTLTDLCKRYLRAPTGTATEDTTGDPVLDFAPALTVPEQATYDRLLSIARAEQMRITPAEWQNIESDIATVKAFVQNASPTNPQAIAASKSTIRILAALIRS